jgi:hypothetical protein
VERILTMIVRGWGGPEALTDPDANRVLNGGLALCSGGEVLVKPACCGDLGNLSEWREAAAYRQSDWRIVWVGHPWVAVRFEDGRLLVSEPHEHGTANAMARWSIKPDELGFAVAAAEVELDEFANRLQQVLADMRVPEASLVSRKLAGLVD